LVAAFYSRVAKSSRYSRARVPNGQGGTTMGTLAAGTLKERANRSSHYSEIHFSNSRSYLSKGSRK